MSIRLGRALALALLCFPLGVPTLTAAQTDYRVLATNRTSTMEAEMNEAAAQGFRLADVMGGETAFGGSETVVVMSRASGEAPSALEYRLLATRRTSTMMSELEEAGRQGFGFAGQTVFDTAFGGQEVVVILERDPAAAGAAWEYRLLATRRTSTLEQELQEVGPGGFELMGLAVGETAFGGREVVAILSRSAAPSP